MSEDNDGSLGYGYSSNNESYVMGVGLRLDAVVQSFADQGYEVYNPTTGMRRYLHRLPPTELPTSSPRSMMPEEVLTAVALLREAGSKDEQNGVKKVGADSKSNLVFDGGLLME